MFLAAPASSDAADRVRQSTVPAQGFVMNLTQAWAWRPDVFESFAALRAQLLAQASLSKRDQAVLVCAAASQLGDSYCSLAWGKALAAEAGTSAAAAVLAATESRSDSLTARDRALAAWARKVVADPNGTTAADVDALRAVGFDDRGIFEVTVFVAFRSAFSTVNDALGAAPDWQLVTSAPEAVIQAVHYGRPAAPRPA